MNRSCRVVLAAWVIAAIGCGSVRQETPDAPDASPPGDGGPIDAPPDTPAPKTVRFDMVYVNDFTVPFNFTGVNAFGVIINRGTMPFVLSSLMVKGFSDDNAAVDVRFRIGRDPGVPPLDPAQLLAADHAAGEMSAATSNLFYGGGLLAPAQVFDDEFLRFQWDFNVFAPVGAKIQAVVKLGIGDGEIDLPITITVSQTEFVNHTAARLSSR
jgi:hypothetical protein